MQDPQTPLKTACTPRQDPSTSLRGFAKGGLERLNVEKCYAKNEQGVLSFNMTSFQNEVDGHLPKTDVTILGEGTFAVVVAMVRTKEREQKKRRIERESANEKKGISVKLPKNGHNVIAGSLTKEMKAVQTLFSDERGGWRMVNGLQSNWFKTTNTGRKLHLMTVADWTLQDKMMSRKGAENMKMSGVILDNILMQLLRGLAHIHALGMVHGDISSNNVLITNGERVSAAWSDFGCTRKFPPTSLTECYLGSQYWYSRRMVLAPLPLVDPCDEIWALGVITHNFTTDRHPFASPGEAEVSMFSLFVKQSMFLGRADLNASCVADTWRELSHVLPNFRPTPLASAPGDMSTVFSNLLKGACLRTQLDGRPANAVLLLKEFEEKIVE